jgi:hypothetical protein
MHARRGPADAGVTCERCGLSKASAARAVSEGWSRFEALRDDGETVYYVTVCKQCLTEAEEAGVWPTSPSAKGG